MSLAQALSGVSGILVTPFDEAGDIAPKRLLPIIDRAVAAGVSVLTANGNTSEFYGLTRGEAGMMIRAASEQIEGRVPLVAGIGRGVRDACHLAKVSAEAGAAALMIHQPPDPFCAPEGIADYVRAVVDAAPDVPIVLYLRNDAIGTKVIARLCGIEGVVGVKWATPNPMKLKAAMGASPEEIIWVGGLAEVWALSFYTVGARGFTSGLMNVWPERSVAISQALEAGKFAQAQRLVADVQMFEDIRAQNQGGANVSVVKAALAMLGHPVGHARPPAVWPLSDEQQGKLRDFLRINKIDIGA